MQALQLIRDYSRFVGDYRSFLSETVTLAEARRTVEQRLESRGSNFLTFVAKTVFEYPDSPYLPLMRLADCGLGDLEKMVPEIGVEATLQALQQAGIYFSFEEYKGRVPVIRDGKEIGRYPPNFDNPTTRAGLEGESGSSTGRPTRVVVDLSFIAHEVAATMLAYEAHGVLDAPMALWMGVLPDASGPKNLLRQIRSGQAPQRWFVTREAPSTFTRRAKCALYNQSLVWLGRLFGAPVPRPTPTPLDHAVDVAEWIAGVLVRHGRCLVYAQVSKGVRVAIAASEAGIDLTGTTFVLGAEPLTPAKAAAIRSTNAVCVPVYAFSEHGHLALGCAAPLAEDEVHLFEDSLALIQCPRRVPGQDLVVESFHWTSLVPTAPKVLLNVESDDYGVVERRQCGCGLERSGFTTHIRNIRSFRKLTGEGITLIGSDAIRVLEEVLPARFGGTPLDYQIVEQEDEDGLTRVYLYVDPSIALSDEAAVIAAFAEGVSHAGVRHIWGAAGTLRIKRAKPLLTGHGKLFPLQLRRNITADR
jgi:hypothetical protein